MLDGSRFNVQGSRFDDTQAQLTTHFGIPYSYLCHENNEKQCMQSASDGLSLQT